MAGLKVTVDGRAMEKWATELSARGLRNSIRRAVDRSATAARKVALEIIANDIGVPKARLRPGVTKLRRTTLTDLSASFTASKLRIGILNTSGASISRGPGRRASTFRLTGGGSASLSVRSAFVISANGGRFIAIRRSKQRLPVKGIYAEMPSQAMGQDKAAARAAWQKAANGELAARLPQEIQKQLMAEGLPYVAPADNGE